VALLLEYFQGRLPGWLAPVQLLVIPVSAHEREPALQWAQELRNQGLRVQVDESEGSLSKRVLFAHRVRPFSKVILGAKEVAQRKVQLQYRDEELSLDIDQIASHLAGRVQIPE
jgi:threonyl-tRNA synthetase